MMLIIHTPVTLKNVCYRKNNTRKKAIVKIKANKFNWHKQETNEDIQSKPVGMQNSKDCINCP